MPRLEDFGPEVQRRVARLAPEVRDPKYGGQNATQVATQLNAPRTYEAVAPFGPADLRGLLSPLHLDAVIALGSFDSRMLPMLESPDPKTTETIAKIGLWLGTLISCGRISTDEYAACSALLSRTSTYANGPSIGESLGCPAVQDFEVELARSVV